MDQTDHALIGQYRQGRVEALDALVERHRAALYGFIAGLTGAGADADDVFQEVWFKVIRKLGRYRRRNFRGWLIRIARNTVIDRARRRKPDLSLDCANESGSALVDRVAGAGADPVARAADAELGGRIAAAVATLPPEQKEVFLMRAQAGLPFKEIAGAQGVSLNTALARMHYAVGKLRSLLAGDYRELGR